MLDLSPVKILLVLIVAMVLLGPDKLPKVARQLGAGWRRFQDFRDQIDHDVRQNIPDLPSSHEIARYARSPGALLERLARTDDDDRLVEDPGAPADHQDADPVDGDGWAAEGGGAMGGHWPEDPGLPPVPDDPSCN